MKKNGDSRAWLGIIADDYTGATDVACHIRAVGYSVVQYFGVPTDPLAMVDADCVIVALKSRSTSSDQAVQESVSALDWLAGIGVEHFYFKYCSTFDSTKHGNIGPVLDALKDRTGSDFVLVAPSAPRNGRTVFRSRLFVGDELLAESAMQNHPLNPMIQSDVRVLLGEQTERVIAQLCWERVQEIDISTGSFSPDPSMDYLVADAVTGADLRALGSLALRQPLSSGSAGLAAGIAEVRRLRDARLCEPVKVTIPSGPTAIIAGSASAMTQRQVARFRKKHQSFFVDPIELANGHDVVRRAAAFAAAVLPAGVPLIYSTTSPTELADVQRQLGVGRAAHLIEEAMGRIATHLVRQGVRRLLVAGGETSGAVVQALGVTGVRIGHEIDPGVPWSVTLDEPCTALVLKSGNFGREDLFIKVAEGSV